MNNNNNTPKDSYKKIVEDIAIGEFDFGILFKEGLDEEGKIYSVTCSCGYEESVESGEFYEKYGLALDKIRARKPEYKKYLKNHYSYCLYRRAVELLQKA